MASCCTTDAIFMVRQLQEKHLIANQPLYMAFVYLKKKSFGCVHQVFIWLAWNKRLVSAPCRVHVQGCKKPGKSRWWILPVILVFEFVFIRALSLTHFSSSLC